MRAAATPLDHAHDPATRERWIGALARLIGFPTVSAHRSARPHLQRCAEWLAGLFGSIGMHRARVLPGVRGGAPSVYADWLGAPGRRTVLLYGHYDVQPAEPLAEWRTPPFRATVHDGKIYGRGSSDDKGQLLIHLCALEAYLATGGALPVNVKVWLEGEEELGSPSLETFLDRYADALRARVAVVSDTELAGELPSIVYGLRGALGFELDVRGAPQELHSGRFGGAVLDPLQHVCSFVARMHDARGRIAIPGFLRGVRELPWSERARNAREHAGDAELIRRLGAVRARVDDGYSIVEHATIRPAITLHGISGGYTGPGWKAIVPTRALARASARLVPDQDPQDVAASIAAFARRSLPRGLHWTLRFGRGTRGVRIPTNDRVFHAAVNAVRDVWGAPPPFTITGGTIPIVEALHRRLAIPVVVLGFGREDDRIHGADERFDVATFYKGIDTMIRLLAELA
ncbi:MAG: M20/M25/M40 family metallo-hydrolase [Candidatus Eremiobacteraeota bacterium]|nr:M20/M25/M40 family metallo-hydrolase [Candidatus Eremiobacteraeota bacterium]